MDVRERKKEPYHTVMSQLVMEVKAVHSGKLGRLKDSKFCLHFYHFSRLKNAGNDLIL